MTDEENIDNIFKAVLVDGEQKKAAIDSKQSTAAAQTTAFSTTESADGSAISPVTPAAETDPTTKAK